MTYFLLTNNPADTIYDITLTATVGADNTGHPFVKTQDGLVGKTLKSFDFQTF
jgi:hypothetical protein